jgi:hypothetical protein
MRWSVVPLTRSSREKLHQICVLSHPLSTGVVCHWWSRPWHYSGGGGLPPLVFSIPVDQLLLHCHNLGVTIPPAQQPTTQQPTGPLVNATVARVPSPARSWGSRPERGSSFKCRSNLSYKLTHVIQSQQSCGSFDLIKTRERSRSSGSASLRCRVWLENC